MATPEQTYFNRFPAFTPNPRAKALDNFSQLAISQGWQHGSRKYKAQKKTYLKTLAATHISSIDNVGAAERLASLQELCTELNIVPVPTSITQCTKVLQTRHVCIIDLIDHHRLGTRLVLFRSRKQLQEHVVNAEHYFPKQEAKSEGGGLLKVLLRTILE